MADDLASFATHTTLPAIVEAGLEGRLGSTTRDGDAARLSLGCYEVFGGNAGSPGARRLIAGAKRRELVYGNDPAWRAVILEVRGDEVVDRPMTEFDASGLDPAALARVASTVFPGLTVRRLDLALAGHLDGELEPHGLQVFPAARELVERGLGFGAVTEDGILACTATSYTLSSRSLEVAIATRPAFRGRGLAMVVGAASCGRHWRETSSPAGAPRTRLQASRRAARLSAGRGVRGAAAEGKPFAPQGRNVVTGSPLLQAALNGSRDHPRAPRTPGELAEDGRAAVDAGARVLHLHPYDTTGRQTLAAEPCASALWAVRAACPGIPVSLSTSAEIEPDPGRRLELVSRWTVLPELVTANQGEPGIAELCAHLVERGVAIEAGLLSFADAEAFVRSGLAKSCVRVLIEPLDADPQEAVAHAAAMEDLVLGAGIALEQVHHGEGLASWAVNERALRRGYGIRTGLEDTTVLPDGRPAADNAALVRAAVALVAKLDRAR